MCGEKLDPDIPQVNKEDTMKRLFSMLILVLSVEVLLAACGGGGGGGGGGGENGGPGVTSISINPSSPGMLMGGTLQLTATVMYSDGSTLKNPGNLTWQSSSYTVAQVSTGGKVTAASAGTTTVTASLGGATGSAIVTVNAITNKVILYAMTASNSTIYLPPGVSIDTSKQNLIRYVPDLGLADVVAWNTSYSYAQSTMNPYTVDNRLFTLTQWSAGTAVAEDDILEYDPHNDHIISGSIPGARLHDDAQCCGAVVGNTYYYTSAMRYDIFSGWVGGDFKKFDMATGVITTLLKRGDADLANCFGLTSSNGTLYDAAYYPVTSGSTDYVLEIHKRDLTTGKKIPAWTKAWTISNGASYNGPKMAFDGGTDTAYAVFQDKSSKQVVILTFTFSGTEQQIFSQVIPNIDSVNYVQVMHGYLAIGKFGGDVFVYDTSTGAGSIINMPFGYYAIQMLYLTQ